MRVPISRGNVLTRSWPVSELVDVEELKKRLDVLAQFPTPTR